MKKYIMTDETKIAKDFDGNEHTVHRIEYTKEWLEAYTQNFGNLKKQGGWIESEYNLSQYSNSLLLDDACIMGRGQLIDSAIARNNATIDSYAIVGGNAELKDNARVTGFARVDGNTKISGDSRIMNNAYVTDNVIVEKQANVSGPSFISGNAIITDNAYIDGNVTILGKVKVENDATITGDTLLNGNVENDYLNVTHSARIDGGTILGNGLIRDNAQISGSPLLNGSIVVQQNAKISGSVMLEGQIIVQNDAYMSGHTKMIGKYGRYDCFTIRDNAYITGNTTIHNTNISGQTEISGNAIINNCDLNDVKISGYNNLRLSDRQADSIEFKDFKEVSLLKNNDEMDR